jgi:DHA1 family multidrug resistance protein-like MFS transporter
MLGLRIISSILPTIAKDLGATGVWMGMIFSGYAISRAIIMPIMGGLSDKYGRRIFIASGLLLLAVISLLYLPAHNVYTLTAVRLLNGLAAGMIIPIAMAYAGEVAQEGKEGIKRDAVKIVLIIGFISAFRTGVPLPFYWPMLL